MRENGQPGKRRARGEDRERVGSTVGEDEVVASEGANEDTDVSVVRRGVGAGMVHLLLSPLGYHNHLPGSHFSLIKPLTREEGETGEIESRRWRKRERKRK